MKPCKILFYPNKAKKSTKTEQIPIYLRVSKGSSKAEARLGVAITEEHLNAWNELTQRLDVKGTDVNRTLESIEHAFEGLEHIYPADYPHFSPSEIRDKITNAKSHNPEAVTVIDFVNAHYSESTEPLGKISDGTKKNYRKSIRHFKKYLAYKKLLTVNLPSFSREMAYQFYDYLQMEIPEIGKKGMADVSASGIIKKIKAIFERAYDTEKIGKNPFTKIKLQTLSPLKLPLTQSEVGQLQN